MKGATPADARASAWQAASSHPPTGEVGMDDVRGPTFGGRSPKFHDGQDILAGLL